MKDKTLNGFMYSYINFQGEEWLHTTSFGTTRTRAKRHFNAQNNLQRLEPVKPYKLYEVSIVVGKEIRAWADT